MRTNAPSTRLDDRPALRPGTAVIPMSGAVQLRRGDEEIHLVHAPEPDRAAALLRRLDGRRRRAELLAALEPPDEALLSQLIDELSAAGLLAGDRDAPLDLSGHSVAIAGRCPGAETLAEILGEHGLAAHTGEHLAPRPAPDVAVCVWERPDLSLVLDVNAEVCRHATPCLFVDCSHGRHATVGPFFVAGEGACYACYRRRLHENTAAWPERAAAERFMEQSRRPLAGPAVPPAHRHQVLGLAAGEVVAFLEHRRPVRTLNRAITVDLEGCRTWAEPAWRVPWCEACGTPCAQ